VRVAVIALPPGDHPVPPWLADFEEILSGKLDRGLHRLGSARDEIDSLDPLRCMRHEGVGKRFGRVRGEEAGVGESEAVELRVKRGAYVRVGMAKAGHRRTARSVEIALSCRINDVASVTELGYGQTSLGRASEDMSGHGALSFRCQCVQI